MHVEIRLDLAPFFLEQHRKQEVGPEPAAERSEHPRSPAGAESERRMSIPGEQVGPDNHVPVLDISEALIDVFLSRVRCGGGKQTIQVGRIRLALPWVLECVYVYLRCPGFCLRGLEGRRHSSNIAEAGVFCTGNP